jgi:hypothetical protein
MEYGTTSITAKTKKECRAKLLHFRIHAAEAIGYVPEVSRLVWVRETRSRFERLAVVIERTWRLWFHIDK